MTRKSRREYLSRRKYQGWQLKDLIRIIEKDLNELSDQKKILLLNEHNNLLIQCKEMFDEIALRLD